MKPCKRFLFLVFHEGWKYKLVPRDANGCVEAWSKDYKICTGCCDVQEFLHEPPGPGAGWPMWVTVKRGAR